MQPLDKLLNEYVLWWPGVISANQTTSFHNFIGNQTNPTHTLRQIARGLNKDILHGNLPPSGLTLATVMQFFDPDCKLILFKARSNFDVWPCRQTTYTDSRALLTTFRYGLYRGFVSPENNNFFTVYSTTLTLPPRIIPVQYYCSLSTTRPSDSQMLPTCCCRTSSGRECSQQSGLWQRVHH